MNQRGGPRGGTCGRSGKARDTSDEGRTQDPRLLRDSGVVGRGHRRGRHGAAVSGEQERIRGRIDPLCQQGRFELHRQRQRHARPAVLHHQEGRNGGRGRSDGARLERHLRGDVLFSNSGTSAGGIVFQEASGANVIVSGGTNGFKISGKSYITIKGFTVTGSANIGISVKSAASNITFDTQRRVVLRSTFERQHRSGHQARRSHQLPRHRQRLARQQRPGMHLQGSSTGNRITEEHLLRQREGESAGWPRASSSTSRLATRSTTTSPTTTRTRASGSGTARTTQRVQQRHLQERRPWHRRPEDRPA